MYAFAFNHQGCLELKLTTFVQRIQYKCIKKYKHMWPSLWNILNPIIKLRTFGEHLDNKKHVQIL
jgi:hypothetical protein